MPTGGMHAKKDWEGVKTVTKEELKEYASLKRETEQITEELTGLKSQLMSAKGQIITDMPRCQGDDDKMLTGITKLLELQDRYNNKLYSLCIRQIEIEQSLETLSPTERRLMRYRYIDGLKWEAIARKMHYSWRQVHNIHCSALHKIAHNCT